MTVYHQFAIACDNRDALRQYLRETTGIDTAVHYFPALHQQPAFITTGAPALPVTEKLAASLISLPIQPEVAGPAVARVIEALKTGVALCAR